MASLVSVNVGMPRDVAWQGKTVHTGIWKSPVTGPQTVRRLNIDGDGQGDKSGHGGENRAVFVYQLDSYRYWEQHLGRDDLEYGNFGENLTVEGMADSEVCVGDRYRIGSAEFEVTQPRVTCFRVGMRLDRPDMPSLLVDHNRPGFYMRVIIEGVIEAGGEIVKTANGPNQISVADIDALVGARNSAQLTRPADIRGAGRRACLVVGRCWSRLWCVGGVVVGELLGRGPGVAGGRCSAARTCGELLPRAAG